MGRGFLYKDLRRATESIALASGLERITITLYKELLKYQKFGKFWIFFEILGGFFWKIFEISKFVSGLFGVKKK